MNQRNYVVVSIILISVVILAYVSYSSSIQPRSTPATLYMHKVSLQNTSVETDVINASQGTTQQLNLTLISWHSPKISIPIENLKITAYNSTVDFSNSWDSSRWNTTVSQGAVFNYSFSLSQLVLQPNGSNSTIITVNLANNAPVGRYTLELSLGQIKFLSPSDNDLSYGAGIWLGMIITPKS